MFVGLGLGLWLDHQKIVSSLPGFTHLHSIWAAAIGAETVSMITFARMQRTLLVAGGERAPTFLLVAIAYTATAVSVFIPFAGSSVSVGYTVARLRARGVDAVRAATALMLGGGVALAAFTSLTIAGAFLSARPEAAVSALIAAGVLLLGSIAAARAVRTRSGRRLARHLMISLVTLARRTTGHPRMDPPGFVTNALSRVAVFQLGGATLSRAFCWSLINWMANVAVLAFAIAATGSPIPWRHLLLVWSIGIGAAGVSPIPGGIGVVEATLITSLVVTGTTNEHAVVAVLLYRLISFQLVRTLIWYIIASTETRR